ncbi:MAG: hypothetical protein AAF560_03465 [Acidobacteriota bacterium]
MQTIQEGFPQLASRLHLLIAQIESAEVRVPEDSALISLATDLVPKVTHLLREGVQLLVDVEAFYQPDSGSAREEPLESLSQIGLQISTEFAARDLNDMVFFARADLKSSLENLLASATNRHDQMTLASNCEGGLRRLRKALISVESSIFEFEGKKPPVRQWFDVEVSLQIRKLYWNLRRETGIQEDNDQPLEARLRRVLYRILAFRELSVYPFLRVDDRVNMRQLMKRILEWLNSNERDPAVARRLWLDLSNFAEILVQVSHRQELQDHDLKVIAKAYRTLFPFGTKRQTVPDDLMAELQSVLGLDDELDRLITERKTRPVSAWRRPLKRLQEQLSRAGELASSPDMWPM